MSQAGGLHWRTPTLLTDQLDDLVARALDAARHRSEELGNLLGGQP